MLLVIAVSSMLAASLPIAALAATAPVTAAIALNFALGGTFDNCALAVLAVAAEGYFALLAHRLHSTTLATLEARAEKDALIGELEQAKAISDEARHRAESANVAKSRFLAQMSHELRTPLNAIIGFSEVMIGERFGALGNERYREYMKDIRASGERVIAIVNDLLDLSRIETGKLDLAFTNQNLNELVESCVAVLQPQANRERIIIRTSLAHMLPPVIADARALRQIALNLIGNSIHLANAGGQVIVSTALSDFGEVVLRVRDTGHGLNDNEVAAALQPFRTAAPSDRAESSAVSLSLTKALVEANRAKFQIKTGGRSGTLIEIVFPHAVVRA
jgi:signal transduction histidine kinase